MTLYLLGPEVDGFLPILCIGPGRPVEGRTTPHTAAYRPSSPTLSDYSNS
jgi:hypothetical protein